MATLVVSTKHFDHLKTKIKAAIA